jgi:hypothetical protein
VTAPVLFVDREGDVWRVGGHSPDGDELMVCDSPQNPDDRGPGESFPWTRRTVEMWFGPLVRTEVPRVVEPASLVLRDGTRLVREVTA